MEATIPYNGSGTFSRLYSWVVDAANSVNISSTKTDAEMNGFAAGLTNCVTRDGQSPPSADLPMGGKKLVNLGNASVSTDALNMATGDARYLSASSALPHNLTFNNAGSGAASGAVFDATANIVVSFNTLGAAGLAATNLFTYAGTSPTLDIPSPNNSTTGGLRVRANAVSGFARIQFTAPDASAEYASIAASTAGGSLGMQWTTATPAPGDNSTKLATTAFIVAALVPYAPLASPALTGAPTASTAAPGTNTTQIATTAFTTAAITAGRNPQGQTIASSATVTPTFSDDFVEITAQAAGLTLANPTGSAVNMWGIAIRIKDNATPQTIGFGTQYRGVGVALPTTTVAGKTTVLGMIFNSTLTKWDVVSLAQE